MLGKMRSNTALSGCDFILSGLQKFLDSRPDGASQPFDIVDRNVPLSTLNRADVRPVQTIFVGKILLRNSHRLPLPPQVFAKHLSHASLSRHEFTLDKMMPLRLQT